MAISQSDGPPLDGSRSGSPLLGGADSSGRAESGAPRPGAPQVDGAPGESRAETLRAAPSPADTASVAGGLVTDAPPSRRFVTDVAVVGAGPAGLSAAIAAADAGARVVLLDAEAVVGGQFWRHPAGAGRNGGVSDDEVGALHHDLRGYRELRGRIAEHESVGRITHLAVAEVWAAEHLEHNGSDASAGRDGSRYALHAVQAVAGRRTKRFSAVTINARSLVLATGAYDLQVPFPGWDLPGVMTAGGVQSLLKGHAVLAGRRVVLAGTGPFLLSVAAGLARSGAAVLGVFEASRLGGWLRKPRALRAAGSKLVEGAGYAGTLARHRVGYRTGWTVVRADGGEELERVTVAPLGPDGRPLANRSRTIEADVLAVGWGFAPQLDLPLALGCATADDASGLPVVVADPAQRTTVPGVYAAGEICGVGGASLARVEGEIAGGAAARELTAAGRRVPAPRLARRREALRAFASALQRVYPVPEHWIGGLDDDTIVCRCEEVTAGAIRRAAQRDGAADERTARLLVRPGMGWCQGRICGYATECLVSSAAGVAPRHRPVERPIAVPIPLGAVGASRAKATDAALAAGLD